MFLYFVFVLLLCICIMFMYGTYIIKNKAYAQIQDEDKYTHIEELKNALLSHALVQVYKDKIATFTFDYQNLDGGELPSLSGASYLHAIYSYIVPSSTLKKSPFFSPMMLHKQQAIQKFIAAHIKDRDGSMDFLESFMDMTTSKDTE